MQSDDTKRGAMTYEALSTLPEFRDHVREQADFSGVHPDDFDAYFAEQVSRWLGYREVEGWVVRDGKLSFLIRGFK